MWCQEEGLGLKHTCSAKKRTPLSRSISKVSPSSGLNGFHVRSMQPYGPIAKPRTQARLRRADFRPGVPIVPCIVKP